MNIYMIAQYLAPEGAGEDRFFKLGRELVARGHDVTLVTGSGAVGLELGHKRIGITELGGLRVIAFNVPHGFSMNRWSKLLGFFKFARMVGKQGRNLPRPGLIMAASPPLTAAWPAVSLSTFYKVPLVVEIRELWPDLPIKRGTLGNSQVIKAARRLEKRIYEKANRIVASDREIASAVRERLAEQTKVKVVEEDSDERSLIEKYDLAFQGLNISKKENKN